MRTIVLLLALALTTTTGYALATSADCEASQRGGEGDAVSQRTATLRGATGSGACEGEHWDGEDTTGSTDTGTGLIYLDPNGRIDRVGLHYRSGPEPSRHDLGNNGPADALHLRVIGQGSPGWKEGRYNVGDGTAYALVSVWGVGVVAVSASGHQDLLPCVADGTSLCAPDVGPGPDGALLGTAEAAVYLEDNSDQVVNLAGLGPTFDAVYNLAHVARYQAGHASTQGNVLAAIVHFPHVTQGQDVGEENPDCTQETYAAGQCTRDNTAVTVELLA